MSVRYVSTLLIVLISIIYISGCQQSNESAENSESSSEGKISITDIPSPEQDKNIKEFDIVAKEWFITKSRGDLFLNKYDETGFAHCDTHSRGA